MLVTFKLENCINDMFQHLGLVIIDSIQTISTETIESSPGSIAQVRECSASILRFAKEEAILDTA